MTAKYSNGLREQVCKVPDDERCQAIVELHKETTIQGWRCTEPGRCMKKHKATLTNKQGESMRFCTAHKRVALEGKIDAGGHVATKDDRNAYYRQGITPRDLGEWKERT